MNIICRYSVELDAFLKKVVNYTLNLYENDLKLDALKEIELQNIKEFSYVTDGKTIDGGTKIIVTSRLYDLLPSFDIVAIENNLNFTLIVNTLFHEMGHVSDWLTMPQLYGCVEKATDSKNLVVALFWLEYLAEKRSSIMGRTDGNEYCKDFAEREWRAYKSNDSDCTEKNFFYLNKALAYFMGRTTELDVRKMYLNTMINPTLKEYILSLEKELLKLEDLMPFDDVLKLYDLYDIINKYYKIFKQKYTPRFC